VWLRRPTLRIAGKAGSNVVGIDINKQGIEAARKQVQDLGLTGQAKFEVVNGSKSLQFEETSFSGLICVDAVNHLPGREVVFSDWYRVLQPVEVLYLPILLQLRGLSLMKRSEFVVPSDFFSLCQTVLTNAYWKMQVLK
jgi:ubiquinone/menaquinone biosynthesis C-methylase UbiE